MEKGMAVSESRSGDLRMAKALRNAANAAARFHGRTQGAGLAIPNSVAFDGDTRFVSLTQPSGSWRFRVHECFGNSGWINAIKIKLPVRRGIHLDFFSCYMN
jgi:hypothetical protein